MWFFRYYSDVGACAKCYLSCMTCSGPRRDQCVSCPRGWQLAAGECHPECPQGFFMSEFGCQKCHHYCKTCKGKTKLDICSQTFSLLPHPFSDKSAQGWIKRSVKSDKSDWAFTDKTEKNPIIINYVIQSYYWLRYRFYCVPNKKNKKRFII